LVGIYLKMRLPLSIKRNLDAWGRGEQFNNAFAKEIQHLT
jgi:hypothetical protein